MVDRVNLFFDRPFKHFFIDLYKSLWLYIVIGIFSGFSSFVFILCLDYVIVFFQKYTFLIFGLPLVGLLICYMYLKVDSSLSKGNNLIIEQINRPSNYLNTSFGPLIFITTLLSHMVGGSVGREGTAVQISASLADQLAKYLNLSIYDRKAILIASVSGGFSAVFGTPLAGAFFGLEIYKQGKLSYKYLFTNLVTAFTANFACQFLGVKHAIYILGDIPQISFLLLFYVIIIGVIFGLTAYFYKKMSYCFLLFLSRIKIHSLVKITLGSILLLIFYLLFDVDNYKNLGLQTIKDSFVTQQLPHVFILKSLLTIFTLSIGFKGGEVTPLFFIGATLGSALIALVPLPLAFAAAMGYAAVFCGASNAPFTCTLLGIEIFGFEVGVYCLIVCFTANYFSGIQSIYSSQTKDPTYLKLKHLT